MAALWSPIPGSGYQGQMLASPAHPNGFCPVHCCEWGSRCSVACKQARADFAAAAVALSMYWTSPHRRMYERMRFGHREVSGAA